VYLSAGVYGVQNMAEHLFRKPASAVTLPEAAMIAGLIRAPSTLSPWSNYDGALARSQVVLAEMREQGLITPAQEQAAASARPRIQPYQQSREGASGWAKDYLRQQFRNEFGGDHPPDWRVQTTFDRGLQDAAERAVAAGLKQLNRPGLQAALVAVDPQNGDVLAMVGGADYMQSTFNRAVRSRRQPGSAFKPFVYAAALEHGFSPVSVLTDLDRVTAPGNPEWTPRNASLTEDEENQRTLRAALLESNNPAAVELQQKIGTRTVIKMASDAGLTDLPDVPSLALGTGLVTPLDLTAAFSMFPADGEVLRPRGLVSVFDANGGEVFSQSVERTRILSEQAAFQMVTMLRDVVDRGTGSAVRTLGVGGPVAGKTGTTNDYRDAWFVGFSRHLVAGVWVGFDQPATIVKEGYAARVALPIWADFMKRSARARPPEEFPVPPGLEPVELCSVSYLKPVQECPTYLEYFKEGDTIPSALCPIHRGTLKQRAARAVQGMLRSIGSRIAGIFRR
jgi:penicillin-binding protein 1A